MTPIGPSPDTSQNSAFAIPFDLRIENCEKSPLRCNVTTPCGDEHIYCTPRFLKQAHLEDQNVSSPVPNKRHMSFIFFRKFFQKVDLIWIMSFIYFGLFGQLCRLFCTCRLLNINKYICDKCLEAGI